MALTISSQLHYGTDKFNQPSTQLDPRDIKEVARRVKAIENIDDAILQTQW